jgi:ubiquinone/menaquinone biosynthesis C-methylase UbiE
MPAAYDTYDYPSYWVGRDYEHYSEISALKGLLQKIPKTRNILEIGAGYGRLAKTYIYRGKKIILSDPSSRLLAIARDELGKKYQGRVKFIHSSLENLPARVKGGNVDLAICIRVLHHIENTNNAFEIVNHLLSKKGYFIVEFANKSHFKATLSEFKKGNLTFPLDISPKDLRSKSNLRKNTLPFINYHPDDIIKKLEDNGFEILERRSVSNIRYPFFKKILPLETLLSIEKALQKPLAYISFGPSMFILARKKAIWKQ